MGWDAQSRVDEREATFVRLMEQYKPALHRLVSAYETDRAYRDDLFQEIALGLWQAIPAFRGDSSERTWLYRIAHNIAISELISRRTRKRRELPESASEPAVTPTVDRELVMEERRHAMLAAIQELPALDREIILLHLENLSYVEIEQVSGLSQSAIATRLSRIRDRLTEAVRNKEVRT